MPEWSKGYDLRSYGESLVGSNPTPSKEYFYDNKEHMPEWLRGWTANPLGSALAGSNPAVLVMIITILFIIC